MSVYIDVEKLPHNTVFGPSDGNGLIIENSYNKDQAFYSTGNKPIGSLRYEGVSNAQYKMRHPVYDDNGNVYGHIGGGMMDIGYTYCCLYSDKGQRFFVSHIHYQGSKSYISSVEATGRYFFFSRGPKFKRTSFLTFRKEWVGQEKVFKFVDDGEKLLCITNFGLCLINVYNCEFYYNNNFGNEYAHCMTGMSLSPNNNLLAVSLCTWLFTDPVKGKEIYKNEMLIYDLTTGRKLALIDLDCEEDNHVNDISFDKTGELIRILSKHVNVVFRLKTKI